MMTGKRPIVIRLENSYQFHEHSTLEDAKREAHRLAAELGVGGTFVVYAPIAIITKTPPTQETAVEPVGDQWPDDLPF